MNNNQTIAQFLGITKFPYEIRNEKGELIYIEYSKGYWCKSEYDDKGNQTRFENSTGFWWKAEYDANRREIYYEDSYGVIVDNRPKQTELTLVEIATKFNIPLEQLRIKE